MCDRITKTKYEILSLATLHKICAHLKSKHYDSTHGPRKEVVP
jgi:DNA-binding Xre family transcriptional regulator